VAARGIYLGVLCSGLPIKLQGPLGRVEESVVKQVRTDHHASTTLNKHTNNIYLGLSLHVSMSTLHMVASFSDRTIPNPNTSLHI